MKRDYLFAPRPIHAIIAEVAAKYSITVPELLSMRRERRLSVPRQEAYWRCAKETKASLPVLGTHFDRDHTTILYGIRRHEARLAGANGET